MTGRRKILHGMVMVSGLPAVLIAACAGPSLTLYTLGAPGLGTKDAPLDRAALVIEVARVTMPDYLDTQDIFVRHGSTLEGSHRGRWASRLSLGATALLTRRLAQRRPDALVTSEQQTAMPSYRILIDIGRLDVAADGVANLEADWLVVPGSPSVATRRDRTRVSLAGPVETDQEVVDLESRLLMQLGDAIDVASLR